MKRWVGLIVVALVLAGAMVGTGRPSLAGTDPEPKVVDVEWHYEPGPGWPAGWAPPSTPTEIPQAVYDAWNWEKSIGADAPARLEMRVLPFLPPWTKEYPWLWSISEFRCGDTRYVYFHPIPDRELLYKTYGDGYTYSQNGIGGVDCIFTPVNNIEHARVSDEAKKQLELRMRLEEEFVYARLGPPEQGGLKGCYSQDHEGSLNNIYVCFNDGNASERFDVPAYLDTTAGRVRVPVRFVSEMMQADVTWDNPSQTVTIRFPAISHPTVHPAPYPGQTPVDWVTPEQYGYNGNYKLVETTYEQAARTVTLTVGKKVAVVDGKEVAIDAPPVLVPPGRVMVPVRFVSEVMGAKVYWVGKDPIFRTFQGTLRGTYQVHIFTKAHPFYEYPSWFLETRAQRT